jgi:anti-anti-sigma factor
VAPLEITAERQGQQLTLRLRGELDFASRRRLISAVTVVAGHRNTPLVVLDLSSLRFADCAGLGAVVWAYLRLGENGQDLKITGAQPIVRRLLAITGLDTYLPLG